MFYNGMKIAELALPMSYKQNRTHRKVRINKKWRKRYGTTPIYWDDSTVYIVNNVIYAMPKVVAMIKAAAPQVAPR